MKKYVLFLTTFVFLASFISAASYSGSFDVDVGDATVNIGTGGCIEDWSGSFWSACDNNTQTFVCFDRNTCGSYSLKPQLCGTTQECNIIIPVTPGNSGGSSSGGSGSSGSSSGGGTTLSSSSNETEDCFESWECSDWRNLDKECGTRTCSDLNECGAQKFKPYTERKCEGFSSSGITGAVIGGITNFVKSGVGIVFILVIIAVALGIIITSRGKPVNVDAIEKSTNVSDSM